MNDELHPSGVVEEPLEDDVLLGGKPSECRTRRGEVGDDLGGDAGTDAGSVSHECLRS